MKNGSENELGDNHMNAIFDAMGVTRLVRLGWFQAGQGDNIYVINDLLRIALRNVPLQRKSRRYESGYFLGRGVGSGHGGYQAAGHGWQDRRRHPTQFCKTFPVYYTI